MQLYQQSITGTRQVLPATDNAVVTGYMGACVSVIILYNPDAAGVYQDVVGYHGAGGAEAINFPDLLYGIPNQQDTRIEIVAGADNRSDHSRKFLKDQVMTALRTANLANIIQVRTYHCIGNASIDRSGNVTFISRMNM